MTIREISLNREKKLTGYARGICVVCICIHTNKKDCHIMQAVAECDNVMHFLLGNITKRREGREKERIEDRVFGRFFLFVCFSLFLALLCF